jgi:hypothetical protein
LEDISQLLAPLILCWSAFVKPHVIIEVAYNGAHGRWESAACVVCRAARRQAAVLSTLQLWNIASRRGPRRGFRSSRCAHVVMATWYRRTVKFLSTIVVAALSIGALHAVQPERRSVTVADGITVSVREAGTGTPAIALHGGPGFRDYLHPISNR